MSKRPFIAARWELFVDRGIERLFRLLGWQERVIPYTAYGDDTFVRVLGRVVLSPTFDDTHLGKAAEEFLRRRGWRNFLTLPCVHARYAIHLDRTVVTGTSDRGGYIDHRIRDHDLAPGWRDGTVSTSASEPVGFEAQIVGADQTFGVVSDIDDTILTTMVPRLFISAWNSFFRREEARLAVPGMAAFLDDALARRPGSPVFYLSTGAWNTHGFLTRFMRRHRYPRGAMLLTDWGPTNTGWFRSGPEHKRGALQQLAIDFPHITWLLVGDDGQHDPEIYGDFAASHPDHVTAIAIRQLSPAEQFLAHGTMEPLQVSAEHPRDIPVFRAPDGRGLRRVLDRYLSRA